MERLRVVVQKNMSHARNEGEEEEKTDDEWWVSQLYRRCPETGNVIGIHRGVLLMLLRERDNDMCAVCDTEPDDTDSVVCITCSRHVCKDCSRAVFSQSERACNTCPDPA